MYTVYIQYFWQGNHQIYSNIQCIYIRFWRTLHIFHCKCRSHVEMQAFRSGDTYFSLNMQFVLIEMQISLSKMQIVIVGMQALA